MGTRCGYTCGKIQPPPTRGAPVGCRRVVFLGWVAQHVDAGERSWGRLAPAPHTPPQDHAAMIETWRVKSDTLA